MEYLKKYAQTLNLIARETLIDLLESESKDMKEKLQSMLDAGFFKEKEKAQQAISEL